MGPYLIWSQLVTFKPEEWINSRKLYFSNYDIAGFSRIIKFSKNLSHRFIELLCIETLQCIKYGGSIRLNRSKTKYLSPGDFLSITKVNRSFCSFFSVDFTDTIISYFLCFIIVGYNFFGSSILCVVQCFYKTCLRQQKYFSREIFSNVLNNFWDLFNLFSETKSSVNQGLLALLENYGDFYGP